MPELSYKKPTTPGWYWYETEYTADFLEPLGIVKVIVRPGHKYLCICDQSCPDRRRDFYAVNKIGGRWSGPIEEPTNCDCSH